MVKAFWEGKNLFCLEKGLSFSISLFMIESSVMTYFDKWKRFFRISLGVYAWSNQRAALYLGRKVYFLVFYWYSPFWLCCCSVRRHRRFKLSLRGSLSIRPRCYWNFQLMSFLPYISLSHFPWFIKMNRIPLRPLLSWEGSLMWLIRAFLQSFLPTNRPGCSPLVFLREEDCALISWKAE